jgi:hypothetical protein
MNSSQVVAVELEKVRDKVPILFERDDTFYSTIEKKDVEKVSTRDMRAPLELRPGGDFGAFDIDGGDMGRGDGPTYDKALISTVNMKFTCEWTAKSEWGNDDSRKAVLKTFRRLLATSMAEFRRHIDSQCMTGGDGVLGTVSAVSTAAGVDTITLDSDGFGARLVRFGQKINIYNSGLTVNRTTNDARKISFCDYANKQIKIPAVTGITVGDKIVVSGVSATPPTWLQGVSYHHSDASTGTWLGLDRSTTPEIRANRVNAGSSALALPFARLALNKVGDRVGQDNMKKVTAWMHPCQKQAYEELGQLVSVIQKSAKDEALDLYFGDSMQMAGAPVRTHYSWNRKRIDFVVPEVWGRAEMHPAGFYEVEGRRLFEARGASGGVATATMFYLVASFNTFVSNPAVCAYIDNLTIPTGY